MPVPRVQLRALLSTTFGFALVGCGDPPAGTATGAMSAGGVETDATDTGATAGVTEGVGGSATSGATTGGGGEPTASESGSGASGTGDSGTTGGGADTSGSSGGSTGDEPASIGENCAAGEFAAGQVDTYRCACDVEEGLYPNMEACLDKQGQEQLVPGCSCEVYAQHPVEAGFIACYAEAVTSLAKCLDKMTCADDAGQDLCVTIYFGALEKCPDPTKATTAQIAIECGGAVPIECGSGETVPIDWACDGEPDCADMSDESDCFFSCGDGELVSKLDECDGEYDCMNGADEKGCPP